MIRTFTVALTALLAFAGTAAAQNHPVLKAEATVTGNFVHVGDLVENAGIIADVPIFRAPDLGSTGTVPASAVVEAVRTHALIGLDTAGISEVTVTRPSRTIPAKDIENLVASALSRQFALGEPKDIAVNFERELRAIQVEPTAKGEPRLTHINYEARTARFEATVEVPTGATTRGLLRLTGRAIVTVEIVTLARPLDRGALIRHADLVVERRPRADIGRDIITDGAQVVGLATRNALSPGRPLRASDLMKPELVQRGETVTLVYEAPGILLTVRGKATDGGAEGDVIGVTNEQSKRTVQGVVSGPGRVTVSTGSRRLVANLPPASSQ